MQKYIRLKVDCKEIVSLLENESDNSGPLKENSQCDVKVAVLLYITRGQAIAISIIELFRRHSYGQ